MTRVCSFRYVWHYGVRIRLRYASQVEATALSFKHWALLYLKRIPRVELDLNSMYALVLGLLLVLGLSGDASGMCGESRQQI